MENEKKVILSLEEYEKLKADSEALTLTKEELKKDCEERGYYVDLTLRWEPNGSYGRFYNGRFINLASPLRVITKDEALELAQETIDELQKDKEALISKVNSLEGELRYIRSRNLIQRIFHKY